MNIIETERLILRTWEASDVKPFYDINQDPKVIEFFLGSLTIEEVQDFIARMNQQFETVGYTIFAAEEKATGQLMGFIGLNIPKWPAHFMPCVEIGWRLGSQYWGKGYATEGAKAVLAYGFNQCQLKEIVAFAVPENIRSIRVMEKLGMQRDFNADFAHPNISAEHKLSKHILYRINAHTEADILKKDHIDIVPYNSEWPKQANVEINTLRSILPNIIDIQHVGSTAIPGMAAKPIIDIQIAVKSLEAMKMTAIPILQKLGYEYWYDNPDKERMFFVKGMPPFGEKRTHHVHIVEPTSKHWSGKIAFRDYLIAHPEVAQAYLQLKLKLAQEHTYDREAYTDAKAEFVNKILKLV